MGDILNGESHDEIFINIAPAVTTPLFNLSIGPTYAVRMGNVKYMKAAPLYDGWYKYGYELENPGENADPTGCVDGCVFDLSKDPHERAANATDDVDAEAERLWQMIEDIMNGGDYIPIQTDFFAVNTSALGFVCHAPFGTPGGILGFHTVFAPYMESPPHGCLHLGPREDIQLDLRAHVWD